MNQAWIVQQLPRGLVREGGSIWEIRIQVKKVEIDTRTLFQSRTLSMFFLLKFKMIVGSVVQRKWHLEGVLYPSRW